MEPPLVFVFSFTGLGPRIGLTIAPGGPGGRGGSMDLSLVCFDQLPWCFTGGSGILMGLSFSS